MSSNYSVSLIIKNKATVTELPKIPFYLFADIDECENPKTNGCHPNASCNNTEGSYVCLCMKGFEGDGRNCTGKHR